MESFLAVRQAFRGTTHSIDAEHTAFDLEEARSRIGDSVTALRRAAFLGASSRQRSDLEAGKTSWAAFYRVAAKGVFGEHAARPVRYAMLLEQMAKAGLEKECDAMLGCLPRPLLRKLRESGAAPFEIFTARSHEVTAWTNSPHPMKPEDLFLELARGERDSDVRALVDGLPKRVRERFEAGVLPAREVHREIEARRRENVEVLVIGAGAAGIGAANELIDRGHSVVVLESKDRSGGRAFTARDSAGNAFDHGGAWLHRSETNPFWGVAESLGFETVSTEKFQKAFSGGDPAEDASMLRTRIDAMARRWEDAARKRPDAKASMMAAPEHPLDPLAVSVLGPLEVALDLDQFTVGEFTRIIEEKNDRMVVGGLGSVVRAFSHGLPIELDNPVESIRWGGDGVLVTTGAGRTFRAKKVVLTVSPEVLAHRIVFDPPLPDWKVRAVEDFQMASFEKIELAFEHGTFDHVQPNERACGFDDEGHPFELLVRPFGSDAAAMLVGGDWARSLVREPPEVAIQYALGILGRHYGSAVLDRFRGGIRTTWSVDPDVGGTWAVRRPSASNEARTEFGRPVAGKLYTAGEACAGFWAATVNGAFFNGREVAAEVADSLRGEVGKAVAT